MECKYCQSIKVVKHGKANGKQRYLCKDCNHKFFVGSDFPRMRTKSRIIASSIDFYFEGLSVRKIRTQIEKLYGVSVSQVTVWKWLTKYSDLVKSYVITLKPELSGLWHEDETMLSCEGRDIWFWEMIDEDTKFLVASHISRTRTMEDTIAIFKKGLDQSKVKPKAVFVDGCNAYDAAFNKVFYSRYKADKVTLVKKVGITARKTNNIVERLHGTLKDRTRSMRGLKDFEGTKSLLEGYTVHYNFVRPHQSLKGKTPAQASGIIAKNDWHWLVKEATKYDTLRPQQSINIAEVLDQ